jgi:hypothetical protein
MAVFDHPSSPKLSISQCAGKYRVKPFAGFGGCSAAELVSMDNSAFLALLKIKDLR